MSQTAVAYYCILTDAGSALEAEAHARGVPVRISHIAVGDGGGEVPAPDKKAVALVHEVYRRQIDSSRIDEDDPNICWISAVIPADVGGFWIREFAIYAQPLDEGGEPVFYAWGNHAPYYKIDRILGQATTHELEIPIIMSGTANVQIVVKESGYASQSALNGLATTIGQMKIVDREFGERISALEQFDKLHDIIATLEKLGHVKPDGMTIGIKQDGTIYVTPAAVYELCEFYYFRNPDLRPGFEPLNGCVIEDAADLYPEAWAYLQTVSGQKMCLSETEWQNLSAKGYYTLADGTVIGFNGIGGVPFYSLNTATGALRMPDIRGMYPEAAGFDSLNVGGVKMDTMRQIASYRGVLYCYSTSSIGDNPDVFSLYGTPEKNTRPARLTQSEVDTGWMHFQSGRVVPTGNVTALRRFGVLACAYLGHPLQTAA